jgi:DNA gyrase subunit A
METKEGDFVKHIHIASTHSYFLIFTSKGNAYWLKVYDIPEGSRISRGKALVNLIPIGQDETVKAILPVKQFSADQYIIMATKHGIIKKSELMNYKTALKSARRAIVIEENDELIGVAITNGREDVFIATRQGMTIRFRESAVRCMGRVSRGVIATRLREGDEVIGMEIISSGASILAITENGYGKRTPIEEYRLQSRGGIGLRTIRNIEKVGHVIGVYQVTDDDDVMIMTNMGKIILIEGGQIRNIGRLTQGVRLINLQPNEKVGGAALVVDKNADKEAKAKLAAASAEVLAISELAGVDSELEELPGESADDLGSEDDPIDLPEELDEVSEEDLGDEAADEGDEGDNDEEAE